MNLSDRLGFFGFTTGNVFLAGEAKVDAAWYQARAGTCIDDVLCSRLGSGLGVYLHVQLRSKPKLYTFTGDNSDTRIESIQPYKPEQLNALPNTTATFISRRHTLVMHGVIQDTKTVDRRVTAGGYGREIVMVVDSDSLGLRVQPALLIQVENPPGFKLPGFLKHKKPHFRIDQEGIAKRAI